MYMKNDETTRNSLLYGKSSLLQLNQYSNQENFNHKLNEFETPQLSEYTNIKNEPVSPLNNNITPQNLDIKILEKD